MNHFKTWDWMSLRSLHQRALMPWMIAVDGCTHSLQATTIFGDEGLTFAEEGTGQSHVWRRARNRLEREAAIRSAIPNSRLIRKRTSGRTSLEKHARGTCGTASILKGERPGEGGAAHHVSRGRRAVFARNRDEVPANDPGHAAEGRGKGPSGTRNGGQSDVEVCSTSHDMEEERLRHEVLNVLC